MDIATMIIILVIGFISSFIGVSVGSGGLIVIPALVFLGLPPKVAIASMRVGAVAIGLVGLYRFGKDKKVDYSLGIPAAMITLIGAYFGATALMEVPEDLLESLVGIMILIVLFFVIFAPKKGLVKTKTASPAMELVGYLLFLPLGFWGGFFGGGTGTFMAYVMIFIFGQTFLESAGTRKLPILAYSIPALFIFMDGGIINWEAGILLLIGMGLGSYAGASFAIKKGEGFVRMLFIAMVLISAIKMIFF